MANEEAPLVKTLVGDTDAVAAGSDATVNVGRAPFSGTVTQATYAPNATLTGANTDSRTLSIINKGQSGTGITSVATLAFTSGVNAPASDEKALTLSGTAANLNVAQGDILAFVSTHVGAGLADPGGLVEIDITRTNA
jgi:hypothetical protein